MAGVSRRPLSVLLAATLSGCALGFWFSHPGHHVVPIDTAVAQSAERTAVTTVGSGRLEPSSGEIDLAADVVGVLSTIPVKEGDRVVKGQILAELSNRDAASRVVQAAATLQMQMARREKLKKGPRLEERQQAVAALQEQDASLGRLDHDLTREKLLFGRGYASRAQLEQAQSAQGMAAARRKSSAEALAQIDAGPRREDVSSAEAEVKLAQAQLDEASAALEKTRIRSPIAGVVLRVYKRPGEAVGLGASSAILQVGDLDRIVARTQIDEADIARVAKGARAYVTAPAYPGRRFGGEVTDVSPRLGAKTIESGAPTEKRDASVLDVLVTLDPGTVLPIGLRVDCTVIDPRSPT